MHPELDEDPDNSNILARMDYLDGIQNARNQQVVASAGEIELDNFDVFQSTVDGLWYVSSPKGLSGIYIIDPLDPNFETERDALGYYTLLY